jgi:L-ascorbate metabolism protein UlaG (beta-lactamase superfamily)
VEKNNMHWLALLFVFGLAAFAQTKRPSDEFPTKNGAVKITFIRHASLMIEAGGQVVHVDPWSQGNYEGLPKADLLLLTDIHGDHLDARMIERLKKPGTVIIGPEAVAASVAGTTVMKNGDVKAVGPWTIEAIPMYNIKRGPSAGEVFHPKGRGNGYVLGFGGSRFYIAGDTENIPELRALKNIDVAFVCMNLPYTMPPEEAAEAVRAFHPKVAYPYHYRGSDLSIFQKALAGTGIDVRIRDWYY